MPSTVVYSTRTGDRPQETLRRLRAKRYYRYVRRHVRLCSNTHPEPHELGEFPMTCYTCHVHADS